MKSRLRSFLCFFGALGALFFLLGCDSKQQVVHPEGEEAWEMAMSRSVEGDEVLAQINGHPVTGEEMRLYWKENPELSREEVIEALIDRELLVGYAIKEGYLERPEVKFGRKQGMTMALLREHVEEKIEIDEEKRPRIEQMLYRQRRIPAGLRASHLVILVPNEVEVEGETKRLSRQEREPYFEEALAFVATAREMLGEEIDDDSLREVSGRLNNEVLKGPFEAAVNEHLVFPRVHEVFTPDQLPSHWSPVAREFAEGAEAVATGSLRGTLSEPVRSQFGWHLIRVDALIDEGTVESEYAQRFVEEQLLLDAQVTRLGLMVEKWFQGAQRELYPERLERGISRDGL